jgi:hypothetical protein
MAPPEGLPKMEYRFLGRSGLQVSAISLGGWLTYGGHVENGKHTCIQFLLISSRPNMSRSRKHIRLHESRLRRRN